LKPLTFNSRIVSKNKFSKNEPAQNWFARVPVKRLKQTALTWKVKDKAASQLARSDARLAVSGVNQRGQGETVLPKVFTEGTEVLTPPKVQTAEGQCRVRSCFVRSHKGHITF